MNVKQIRELADIVRANGLTALEITEGETRIRLEAAQVLKSYAEASPKSPEIAQEAPKALEKSTDIGVDFNDVYEVKSPLVGVFYEASAPDAEPFVKVGDRVKKGDILCIVEAMKLMNDIAAPRDGEVVDVCIKSGEVVEYGQTLFKLF